MKNILTAIFLLLCNYIYAQISGKVVEDKNPSLGLPGANVYWAGTSIGTVTDAEGNFTIGSSGLSNVLVASYVGYMNDTIDVNKLQEQVRFRLKSDIELGIVEIEAKREATAISTIQPRNTELITEKELLKAACCNLSESFETNPTVDVNYADAVTGAKEIQMLGLSGNYTQLLGEAIPTMTGLGSIYGLNYIPGPWMESIQVSKGAGSVVNGHNAITGQINIEYKKPEEMDERMFINAFGDNEGRFELNTINKSILNDNLYYMLMFHGSINDIRIDHNDDGFMDMPLARQLNIYNRFRYNSGKRLEGQGGIKIILEDRMGGQMSFNKEDKGTTDSYGAVINTRRVEAYTKTGMVYPEKPYKSMGLQLQAVYHDHESYFGLRGYNALQHSYYANYSYMSQFTPEHKFRIGGDLKSNNYDERLDSAAYVTEELIPGAYAEYTFDDTKRWGIILGGRVDHHNEFGWFVSPRSHIKYNFTPDIIIRVSGGKGFRTPLIFADNIGVMVSSRQLQLMEKPLPEEAWNGGANVTARFTLNQREGSVAADYYYTSFVNQYIIDPYSSNEILYYNLKGNSTASSIQATLTYEVISGLDVKIAAKLDEVTTDYLFRPGSSRPLFPREKALLNVAYETKRKRWRMDATAQWQGVKPLPATVAHNSDHGTSYSPEYTIINAQVTHVFRHWEVYAGSENITDFTQHNPIINADQPFSDTFDASSVWGPISGRKFYAGIRLNIF